MFGSLETLAVSSTVAALAGNVIARDDVSNVAADTMLTNFLNIFIGNHSFLYYFIIIISKQILKVYVFCYKTFTIFLCIITLIKFYV